MKLEEIVLKVREIDGWFNDEQMGFLHPYVKGLDNSKIVEVGTYRGRSTLFLALATPGDAQIVTIDPCNHPWANEYDKAGFKLVNDLIDKRVLETGKVKQLVMTSKEASREFEDSQLDFIFIDGLHEVCEQDINLWLPKLKVSGLIAFHDYDNDHLEVKVPVDEAVKTGKMEMIEAKAWMCVCKKL